VIVRFLIVLMLICLGGCTTTQTTSSPPKYLEMRIHQLEDRLEQKDQQISELQFQIKEIVDHIEGLESYDIIEPIEEKEEAALIPAPRVSTKPKTTKKTSQCAKGLIRVKVDPKEIQTALKNAGYYDGNVDGKIGNQSQEAIREFQTDHGLTVDGIVGKNTWAQLEMYIQ